MKHPVVWGLMAALSLSSAATVALPYGADAARARGIELPLPFGLTWYHMDQDQPFKVKKLEVSSGGSPVPATITDLDNRDESDVLRFDAWVLPFLDVYALVGRTESESEGTAVVPAGVFGPSAIIVPFEQPYDGDVLGLGSTLVYGYRHFFASLDVNYTETDIDISDDDAKALVANPRVGWSGQRGGWKGALWIGAMYQDLKQTLEIQTQFMGVPVTAVVEEEAEEPWNYVVGGSWEISRHWHVAAEGGFGEREHWMLNAGYRF